MSLVGVTFCFFKQKTAYEMRISDWSSDVCSSDLGGGGQFSDGRLPARGNGGGTRRDVPVSGALLQKLSRHGIGRRDGAWVGRSLFPAGHQGSDEAGARRHRGSGAL